MNNISKLSKFGKNVILGINNIIGDNVIISDNVIIGSNNKIFSNNIIYPNVELGDNNVILEGNIIGEHPVNMDEFNGKMYNGVKIGNNNYFHCKSVISGGTQNNKTNIETHMPLSLPIHTLNMFKKEHKINKGENVLYVFCWDPVWNRDASSGLFADVLRNL